MDQQQQQHQHPEDCSSSSISSSPSLSSSRKRQQHECRGCPLPQKYSRIEDDEPPKNHHQDASNEVAETIEDFIVNPRRYRPRPEWYTNINTSTSTNNQEEPRPSSSSSSFGPDLDSALLYCIRKSAIPAAWNLLHQTNNNTNANNNNDEASVVNVENAKGVTPLIMAAQKGFAEMCQALLERGANVQHVVAASGTTSVLQAAHFGQLDVLRVLLFVPVTTHNNNNTHNSPLFEMANYNHTTPLMRAAQEGHTTVVEYLVQKGALVNRKNRERMTALMLASQRGHAPICHYLVTHGADLDARTAQHTTAVALATKRNHWAVVRVLVRAGCELSIADSRGRTARDLALQRTNTAMADLLLDPTMQIDLMRRYARNQRSWAMVRMWTLLQHQRASVRGGGGGDQYHPYHHPHALMIRILTLPAPLMQLIAQFAPLPDLWEKRIGFLTKRCAVNATAALESGLDLIDEVLEEGGFLQACDQASIVPPAPFRTWMDWKGWCRRNSHVVPLPSSSSPPPTTTTTPTNNILPPRGHLEAARIRPNATLLQIQQPQDPQRPTLVELRRYAGRYLQRLNNHHTTHHHQCHADNPLAAILTQPPYHMPTRMLQQLSNSHDISSLVRRFSTSSIGVGAARGGGGGGGGVSFDPSVAMDLILLTSRLCSWYYGSREQQR